MAGIFDIDLKGAADGIGSLLTTAREVITGKKILDPNKALELETQLIQAQGVVTTVLGKVDEMQAQINLADAQSNVWWRQWRSALGWACVLAVVYNFVAMPFIVMIFKLDMQKLDISELIMLLGGMLGLTAAKSFDRKTDALSVTQAVCKK